MRVCAGKVVARASGASWKGCAFRCWGAGTVMSFGRVRIRLDGVLVEVVLLLCGERGMPAPQCPSQRMSHSMGLPYGEVGYLGVWGEDARVE